MLEAERQAAEQVEAWVEALNDVDLDVADTYSLVLEAMESGSRYEIVDAALAWAEAADNGLDRFGESAGCLQNLDEVYVDMYGEMSETAWELASTVEEGESIDRKSFGLDRSTLRQRVKGFAKHYATDAAGEMSSAAAVAMCSASPVTAEPLPAVSDPTDSANGVRIGHAKYFTSGWTVALAENTTDDWVVLTAVATYHDKKGREVSDPYEFVDVLPPGQTSISVDDEHGVHPGAGEGKGREVRTDHDCQRGAPHHAAADLEHHHVQAEPPGRLEERRWDDDHE